MPRIVLAPVGALRSYLLFHQTWKFSNPEFTTSDCANFTDFAPVRFHFALTLLSVLVSLVTLDFVRQKKRRVAPVPVSGTRSHRHSRVSPGICHLVVHSCVVDSLYRCCSVETKPFILTVSALASSSLPPTGILLSQLLTWRISPNKLSRYHLGEWPSSPTF